MIHHVSVIVQPTLLEKCAVFYEALGFARVEPPEGLQGRGCWLERFGHQVHLIVDDNAPPRSEAHTAFIVDNFEVTWAALEQLGLEPDDRKRYWGSKRALVRDPAGNLVEFMEYPPPPIAT